MKEIKMTFRTAAIIVGLLLLPTMLTAQTDEALDPELGLRAAFALDKKLSKGLHLNIEEEVRFDQNFSAFDRFHTTLGATYKLNSYLKVGLAYAMINPYSSSNKAFKGSRHRIMADATGGIRLGDWKLSLKERLQATFRTGDYNNYQTSQPLLDLKSRLKLQYKGWRRIEPYIYAEMRHTLNAPSISAYYDGSQYLTTGYSQYGEAGWFISGHNQCYLNRLRGSIGAEWRTSKHATLTLYLLADYCTDKVIDANAAGTRLKSYTREKGFVGQIGALYTYKL